MNSWAVIVGRGADGKREVLRQVVQRLRQAGVRVGGLEQVPLSEAVGGGKKARAFLRDLAARQRVRVVTQDTDRYRRWVSDLYLGDRWINLESHCVGRTSASGRA